MCTSSKTPYVHNTYTSKMILGFTLLLCTLGAQLLCAASPQTGSSNVLDLLQQEVEKRQALEAQMQKLTETLNSYVHGYAELRKKLNEMNEKLENVTTTLSTTNAEYENVVQKYNDLERRWNDTHLTVIKHDVRLMSMESNFNTTAINLNHLSETVQNLTSLPVDQQGLSTVETGVIMSNITAQDSRLSSIERSLGSYGWYRKLQIDFHYKVIPN